MKTKGLNNFGQGTANLKTILTQSSRSSKLLTSRYSVVYSVGERKWIGRRNMQRFG